MTVFTTIPSLLALYRIDHDLHEFNNRLVAVMKDQVAIENNITRLNASLAELESAGRKLQATISTHDLDMKSRQEHIEKMRTSLNNAKTNKEYSAILIQISAEKEEVSKIEAIILDFMGQLETNNKSASGVREQLDLAQKSLDDSRRQSSQRVAELQSHIRELENHREQAMRSVPAESRKQYDRICQRYPGDAIKRQQGRDRCEYRHVVTSNSSVPQCTKIEPYQPAVFSIHTGGGSMTSAGRPPASLAPVPFHRLITRTVMS